MKAVVFSPAFFLLALLCTGCGRQAENEHVVTKDTTGTFSLPENLKFRFLNKKEFSFYNDSALNSGMINKLPDTLTAKQKDEWNCELQDVGKLSRLDYGATFFSKQPKVHSILPIVIEGSSDDYDALTLLCIDSHGKLISSIELAGGLNGGPDSTFTISHDSSVYFFHDKVAAFQNDSTFSVSYMKYIGNIHGRTSYTIDSIVSTYRIKETGEISFQKKNSIRVLKKEIYDYK